MEWFINIEEQWTVLDVGENGVSGYDPGSTSASSSSAIVTKRDVNARKKQTSLLTVL